MTGALGGSFSLAAARASIEAAATAGLADAAGMILEAAKATAPVLTGELRDSGKSAVDGFEAAVGFTDSKAVAAHENLHDRLRNGKRAKFLELAVHENADAAVAAIAAKLRGAL